MHVQVPQVAHSSLIPVVHVHALSHVSSGIQYPWAGSLHHKGRGTYGFVAEMRATGHNAYDPKAFFWKSFAIDGFCWSWKSCCSCFAHFACEDCQDYSKVMKCHTSGSTLFPSEGNFGMSFA